MLSNETMSSLRQKYQRMEGRVKRLTSDAQHVGKVILADAETGGVAGLLGVIEGRYGDKGAIGPVPLAIIVSGVGHAIGFWIGGSGEDHCHNAARGGTAAHAFKKGLFVGNSWKEKIAADALRGGANRASGSLPSDEDVRRM